MSENQYEDKTLVCIDCKEEFTFDAGEQQFFADRGFSEPKRCPKCRKIMKEKRNAQENTGTRKQNRNSNWR